MANFKQRTQEEYADIEYNYFRYYSIKPSLHDPNAIKAILLKKASDTNPKNPRLARELLEDAKAIMIDDAVFDSSSLTYKNNSGGRNNELSHLKELSLEKAASYVQNSTKNKKIVFYSLMQKITDSSENMIQGENIFTFDELFDRVKYLEKQGFQFIDEMKEDPFSAFEGLDQYFITCGVKNLYEYLNVNPSCSQDEIAVALSNKKAEWAKLSTADRNKKNAYSKLNGKIPIILQQDEQRKMYDLFNLFYEDIWSKLKAKKLYNDFDLDFDDFTNYVSIIQNSSKLSLKDANQLMASALHHYSLNLVGGSLSDELSTCPYCGKLYQKGLKVCPHCGKNLEILCWNCSSLMPAEARTCPHCGVSKTLEKNFNLAKQNLERALIEIPIDENKLDSLLLSLKNVYSKYEETEESKIFKAVKEFALKVSKRKQEKKEIDEIFDQYVTKIIDLCSKKQFVEASGLLSQLKNKLPSYDVKKYETEIEDALKKAKLLLASAQKRFSLKDEKGGLDFLSQALDACKDFTEAKNLLKAYPPKAPFSLQVSCDKEGARLHWQGENDNTITYSVLRKIASPICKEEDGQTIAFDLALNEFLDTSLVSGIPTYYAVFADRKGVHSSLLCSKDAALTFLNVKDVHQEIKDQSIKVLFSKPQGCKTVHVIKKDGMIPPSSLNDGNEIKTQANSFEVTDAEEASFYIVSEYVVNGKKQYSKPLTFTFKKTHIPKELKIVSVSNKGNNTQLQIQYEPIEASSSICLYQSEECFDFDYGIADENIHFQKKYKDLKRADFLLGENKITYEMKKDSLLWLYPVVRNENLYVLCKPILANSISAMESFNFIVEEGNVKIEGKLPEKARNLIALISSISFPKTVKEKDCAKRVCSAMDFENAKGMSFTLSPGVYYISLFSEFSLNGETFYSSPLFFPQPVNCKKKIPLKYAIEGEIDLYHSKKIKIAFKSSSCGTIGKCELYASFPRPQKKGNGVLLAVVPQGELKKKLFKTDYYYSVSVPCKPLPKKGDKVALFFQEENPEFYLQMVDKI